MDVNKKQHVDKVVKTEGKNTQKSKSIEVQKKTRIIKKDMKHDVTDTSYVDDDEPIEIPIINTPINDADLSDGDIDSSPNTKASKKIVKGLAKSGSKSKSKSKTREDEEVAYAMKVEKKKSAPKKPETHNTADDDDPESSETQFTRKNDVVRVSVSVYDPEKERELDQEEVLLSEEYFRLATKPINPKFEIIWQLYKKQHEAHWTAEEIDFSSDRHDFMKLDKNIQHFIKMILAFFAGADSIVNINIRDKFSKIKVKEAEVAYDFQKMMENIHGEVYADMLINIIEDTTERDELINAFKTVKSIKMMIEWAQKWIDTDRRIAFSLVAFAIFEGLMFSGAFAAIYWLKKLIGEDKMKGLFQSNNLIAKDEGMHTNFGCVIYDFVVHRLTQEEINDMIIEAVDIAKTFTQDAIRVDMIGMNVNLMSQYLEYVADRLAVYLGYEKIYNTKNPDQFQFMDTIGFLNKDNFFERRATEYQKAYNDENRADWKFKIMAEY